MMLTFFRNLLKRALGKYLWLKITRGAVYRGAWQNGLCHGVGEIRYAGGATFKGSFYKGSKHGHGEYYSPSGYSYIGDWHRGRQVGYAEIIYKTGDKYIGSVRDGLKHGRGEFTQLKNSRVFKGVWVRNVLMDDVTILDQCGTIRGSIDPFMGSGFGEIRYTNGDIYTGEISGFLRSGSGIFRSSQGVMIRGLWIRDTDVDHAIMVDENGFRWTGKLKGMKPFGYMQVRSPNGAVYESVWQDGHMIKSLSKELRGLSSANKQQPVSLSDRAYH